jgi:hypothetical protein
MIIFRTVKFFIGVGQGLATLNFKVITLKKGMSGFLTIVRRTTTRLGILGAGGVAAFGYITFEITKAILELTGLNDKISGMIERWLTSKEDMDSYVTSIDMAVKHLFRLEEIAGRPMGLDFGLQGGELEELMKLVNMFFAASEKGDRGRMQELLKQIEALAPGLDKTTGAWNRLTKEGERFAESQSKIWQEALSRTETYAEAIDLANKLLREAMEEDKIRGEAFAKETQRLKEILENALKFIDSSLKDVSLFRPEKLKEEQETFKAFRQELGGDLTLIKGFAEAAAERIEQFVEAHEKLGKPIPPELEGFIETLLAYAQAAKDSEESSEAMEDALDSLNKAAENADMVTGARLGEFAAQFELIKIAALDGGQTVEFAVAAMADQIVWFIDVARRMGEEVPPNLEAVEDAARRFLAMEELPTKFSEEMDEMEERLDQFGEAWRKNWAQFGEQVIRTMGDVTATIIVDHGIMEQDWKKTRDRMLKQAISMLVQWGIQRLIWDKITKKSIITEHMANLAGYMAEVYASSFASAAAIPVVGWAMAPGIAAMNVAIAQLGAAGAAASGAGIAGSLVGIGLQEGGIVTRRVDNVSLGEGGPEGVFPLRGERARRAVRELGLGGDAPIINVEMNFTGDNWVDNGVSEELTKQVAESIDELIGVGKLLKFQRGTV